MTAPREFELAIVTGKPEGKTLSFTKAPISVGRGEDADFLVEDRHASKINCHIVRENNEFFVVDNSSTNGAFLNDEKIDRAQIKNGDQVRIGETTFQFRCKQEEPVEEDRTVILPQEKPPEEDKTVLLPQDQEKPPPDPDATVIEIEGAPAFKSARPAIDPEATQIAPADPNATQIAPAAAQAQPVKEKKKKKDAGASPLKKLSALDKAARLRLLIIALGVLVLMMFGAALLIPPPKPTPGGGNQAGGQGTGSEQGDSADVSSGDVLMSAEARIQKAGQMFQLGKTRYEERLLKPGSMYEAIQYFEKAEGYLEGISPKPAIYEELQQLSLTAKEALQNQYNSIRLDAYMLIRKKKYSDARAKLESMLSLVPNQDDERHVLAKKKLKEIRGK